MQCSTKLIKPFEKSESEKVKYILKCGEHAAKSSEIVDETRGAKQGIFMSYAKTLALAIWFMCGMSPSYAGNNVLTDAMVGEQIGEGDDCIVNYVSMNDGEYVLKRIKRDVAEDRFALIREKVVSDIANQINIRTPSSSFATCKNKPAILQELAIGQSIQELKFVEGYLHQRSRSPYRAKILEEKYGPLSLEQTGLTKRVISNMATHDDLAKIAALDTFVNNADRSNPNLFYDKKTDQYSGIDHLAAFSNTSLAKHALRQLQGCWGDISYAEKKALILYVDTLKILTAAFPPEKIEELFKSSIKELNPNPKLEMVYLDETEGHVHFFSRNYKDVLLLISWLDQAIGVRS